MAMAQLVLQHGKQVGNDIQPVCEQSHSLVHFEITPHSLVYGLELWFYPEQLWGVEDRAVQVDVKLEYEELADLHVDLRPAECDFTGQRDLSWDVLARIDC